MWGPVLLQFSDRYPQWFRELIPELASTSRWLRREREPSMYGDEELGLPPTKLYTEPYTRKAIKETEQVRDAIKKLFQEYLTQ